MAASRAAATEAGTEYGADQLADLEAIRALTHRYGLALDAFDLTGTVAVFTPDAVFDCTAFGRERVEGHDRLRAFYEHNQQVMASQVHVFANHIIVFDGADAAHGTNYLVQDGYTKKGDRVTCLALNRDRYVRTTEGWRIRERTIMPLLPPKVERL
jgi:ketosteroid isomerase-like protein